MDYLASSSVEAAKWYWLVDKLSESAKKRALLNVEIDRTTLVASDTINIFVNHYAQAIPGKTYICYGVSGCGKTVAAAHLLHGEDINFECPKRAIMVNAGGSEDFPTDFSLQQNAPNAASLLVNILCASLVFQEKKNASRAAGTKMWEMFSRFRRLAEGCVAPVAEEPSIHLHDPDQLTQVTRGRDIATRADLPILIIDDLSESKANRGFVSSLYTRAHAMKISVLILTKDEMWATKMKDINGGVKILPVDGAITNPRGDSVEPFVQDPKWTGMTWRLPDLRVFAETLGPPDISAELRDGMTPEAVVDLHRVTPTHYSDPGTPLSEGGGKSRKTLLTLQIIDHVHSTMQGRFLVRKDSRWKVADTSDVQLKVSQALHNEVRTLSMQMNDTTA